MCEDCPLKKEIIDPGNFSLTEIFKADIAKPESGALTMGDAVCETCGFSQVEFEKRGRLGCPDCYTHFEPAVRSLIKDMHYGNTHKGKQPQIAVQRVDLSNRMSDLKKQLDGAVETEDFENAATIRDQIIELENQLNKLTEVS